MSPNPTFSVRNSEQDMDGPQGRAGGTRLRTSDHTANSDEAPEQAARRIPKHRRHRATTYEA